MKKTPMQTVKEHFGNKDKLVSELLGMIKRPTEVTKDQFKKKLQAQSNRKLLILHARETTVKESFGSRDKLIDSLLKANMGKNSKEDKGFRIHLEKRTTGQLLDLARRKKLKKN
jgi:hypothetical protein